MTTGQITPDPVLIDGNKATGSLIVKSVAARKQDAPLWQGIRVHAPTK